MVTASWSEKIWDERNVVLDCESNRRVLESESEPAAEMKPYGLWIGNAWSPKNLSLWKLKGLWKLATKRGKEKIGKIGKNCEN